MSQVTLRMGKKQVRELPESESGWNELKFISRTAGGWHVVLTMIYSRSGKDHFRQSFHLIFQDQGLTPLPWAQGCFFEASQSSTASAGVMGQIQQTPFKWKSRTPDKPNRLQALEKKALTSIFQKSCFHLTSHLPWKPHFRHHSRTWCQLTLSPRPSLLSLLSHITLNCKHWPSRWRPGLWATSGAPCCRTLPIMSCHTRHLTSYPPCRASPTNPPNLMAAITACPNLGRKAETQTLLCHFSSPHLHARRHLSGKKQKVTFKDKTQAGAIHNTWAMGRGGLQCQQPFRPCAISNLSPSVPTQAWLPSWLAI